MTRTVRDVAVPLELIGELLGLPAQAVGASFSPTSNTLYIRIPITGDDTAEVFSARVRKTTSSKLEVDLMRQALRRARETNPGEAMDTIKYLPDMLGTITVTNNSLPPHLPANEFKDFPTEPAEVEKLLGFEPGTIKECAVNGVMLSFRKEGEDHITQIPVRMVACQ